MPVEIATHDRVEVIDVTAEVADAVPADLDRGLCTVSVRHTTAGLVVNEADRGLMADLVAALQRLVPRGAGYGHDEVDDNADAHLRATLLGSSVTVPVVDGRLALGTWQSVLLVECDGPRRRQLIVTCVCA